MNVLPTTGYKTQYKWQDYDFEMQNRFHYCSFIKNYICLLL